MRIDELLHLPIKEESIKEVEQFIEKANELEKAKAGLFLARIYVKMSLEEEAINTLFGIFNENIKEKEPDVFFEILDLIIEIYINTMNYDEALKYIDIKQNELSPFRKYLALLDYLKIAVLKEEDIQIISLMNQLLNDDISNEIRLKTYKDFIDYYLSKKEYGLAIEYVILLKEMSEKLSLMKEYYIANYYDALCHFMVHEFEEAIRLNSECLNNRDFIDDEFLARVFLLDIKLLYELKEYRKAMVNDAYYEEIIMKSNVYLKKEYFEICIKLYNALNNRFSAESYQEKLATLIFPKKKKKILKVKKEIVKNVAINDYKKDKNLLYSVVESFLNIQNCIKYIKPQMRFRDILLPLLIETSKQGYFDEVAYVNINTNLGYHYKKERLYDKEFRDLSNSVFYKVLVDNNEQIFTTKNELIGLRDIVSNRDYVMLDYNCVMAFPIYDKKDLKGIIMYSSFTEKLIQGFSYETLRFLTSIINEKLLSYETMRSNIAEYKTYYEAFDLLDIPVKYGINDNLFLNKKAREQLNVSKNIDTSEYLSYISSKDYNNYREFIKGDLEYCSYQFKDINLIEERKIKYYNDEKITISILKDNSKEIKQEQRENELIYKDALTSANNLYAYFKDVLPFIRNEKFSMLMVDIKEFKKINDCYGISYGNEILINMYHYLKVFFEKYEAHIYRISGDDFLIIILGVNDLRSINKISKELIDYLVINVNKKSARLALEFNVGSLRYHVQVNEKMPEKLLAYVNFALRDAKKNNENYKCFDRNSYNDDFSYNQLSAHINACIDQSKIGINYKQVVEGNKVAFYEISPHIYDLLITEEEIKRIIDLRDLTIKLERYLLRQAIREVFQVYETYKKYFRILVKLNYKTLLSDKFMVLINKLLIDTKLPAGLLIIDLYGEKKDVANIVYELRENGIEISTSDFTDSLDFDIDYLKLGRINKYLETKRGSKITKGLLSMCDEMNVKLIISDVVSKSELSILNSWGVKYISYGKKIYINDILKKME